MSGVRYAVGLACWLALTAPASAHSPPHGQRLLWESDGADALPLIVANRGLVFVDRQDGALHFSLRCTEGLGASIADNPSAFFVPDGSLAIGIYSGVYLTSDRGCNLELGSGLVGTSFGMAVGHPSQPGRLLVSSRTLQDQAQVFLSQDYGRSWSPYYPNHKDDYYDSLLIAPSDPQRVYAAGLRADRVNKKLLHLSSVSLDGGQSWQDTAKEDEIVPFAVHTRNPDVVFAAQPTDMLKTVFNVMRSEDRGVNYAVVLEGVSQPSSIAVSDDALWLGISGPGGLYRSDDDGHHFEPALADSVQAVTCLEQRGERLWVCANLKPNTDGVWYSDDDGKTLQKFMTFADVTDPVSCDGDPQALCAGPWLDFDREQHALYGDAGAGDAGVADGGSGPSDAGGMALDAAAHANNDGAATDEADAESTPPAHKPKGCQLGAPGRGLAGLWALLAASLWIALRRWASRERNAA